MATWILFLGTQPHEYGHDEILTNFWIEWGLFQQVVKKFNARGIFYHDAYPHKMF